MQFECPLMLALSLLNKHCEIACSSDWMPAPAFSTSCAIQIQQIDCVAFLFPKRVAMFLRLPGSVAWNMMASTFFLVRNHPQQSTAARKAQTRFLFGHTVVLPCVSNAMFDRTPFRKYIDYCQELALEVLPWQSNRYLNEKTF